jgi:deoxyribodipyrimidine photo-lyase
MIEFPTDTAAIRARLAAIDPARYGTTRNFLDGAVTQVSPYLTHGALTLPEIRDAASAKVGKRASSRLVFELAWREYFQRVWWEKGEGIFVDLKRAQEPVRERAAIPTALLDATTGIEAIDDSIRSLYETGYVHNHARMWTAMLGTNIAQVHWKPLASWYYYHLLDGDLASNTLSWQWVAGTFSSKKYIVGQDNLNKFDPEHRQQGTFLDAPYEALTILPVPRVLQETRLAELPCTLPKGDKLTIAPGSRILLYSPWNLDPAWRADETATRVLVLEPSHFSSFPISPKRMAFVLALGENIPGLKIFVGEVHTLPGLKDATEVRSLAYPTTRHWPGERDAPIWLFPQWSDSKPVPGSFMSFWKSAERWL